MDTELDPAVVNRRIASLLRLKESPVEGEAQAAAEAAARLAQKYRIDLFSFEQRTKQVSQQAEIHTIYEGTFATDWRRTLVRAIAQVNDCKFYVYNTEKDAATIARLGPRYTSRRWVKLQVAGKPLDVQVVRQLFDYLEATISRLGNDALQEHKAEHAKNPYGPALKPNAYADSWRTGCAERVNQRLRQRDAEARAAGISHEGMDAVGTAMVLASVRDQSLILADEAIMALGIRLQTVKHAAKNVHSAGYADGKRAGNNVGLDSQLSSSRLALTRS